MKQTLELVKTLGVVALTLSVFGCDDSNSSGGGTTGGGTTGVSGIVTDTDGSALSGVKVALGDATATTNSSGEFEVDAEDGEQLIIRFNKAGYISTQKRVDIRKGVAASISAIMKEEADALSLDASEGGTVFGLRGAELTAAAGVFVDADGNAVDGDVDVHLTPFDPSDAAELAAVPNLSATTDSGEQAELESFGLLDVTVRQDDDVLQVKDGETVVIRIPAPLGGSATPPDTIPMWSFDEESGVWKEEGEATYLPGEGVYEGEIEHMSLWNADQVMETTCIRGTVVDRNGKAVAGAYVTSQGVDYSGMSDAVSDADGEFCLPVRKSSSISVTVYLSEGGGTTRVVESGSTTVGIPPICSACSDVGEWEVQTGEYSNAGGETVECEDINTNPFAGTCAEDFWQEFAMCFQPAGDCVMSMSGNISWENGARITMQGLGDMYYYGPDGELCGTFRMNIDMTNITEEEMSDFGITYVLPSGDEFVMKIDVNNPNELVMVCPDGTEIVIDAEQQQAMAACTGNSGTSGPDDSMCTFDEDTSDMMGLCETDDDCTSGEICCDFGAGMSMCFTQDMCDMMNSSSG
jgi:hypothetical protein